MGMLSGAFGHFTGTFSVKETARIFKVPEGLVLDWIGAGTLPSRKILGMTRIDHAAVGKAVAAQQVTNRFGYNATAEELLEAGDRYF